VYNLLACALLIYIYLFETKEIISATSLKWVLLTQRTGALSSSITSYELTPMTLYMRKEDEKLVDHFVTALFQPKVLDLANMFSFRH
jgi:hypothetical protein